MRIALGFGLSAFVLIAAGATGLLGAWALGAGAVLVPLAAVVATTAMESRDLNNRHEGKTPAHPNVLRRAA